MIGMLFNQVFKAAGGAFGFLALIPFGGVISSVIGAVSALVRTVFNGLTSIVSNPATLVACGAVAVLSLFYGVRLGVKLDGNKAAKMRTECNLRVQQIESKTNNKVAAAVAAALAAGDALTPLPADLAKACKKSASCRKGEL